MSALTRIATGLVLSVFVGQTTACVGRQVDVTRSVEFQRALDRADRAWKRRGANGLGRVDEALKEALVASPNRPAGLWRMARLYASKGWAADIEADRIEYFMRARYYGERCLMTNAAFAGRRAQYGWEASLAALEGFDPCTVWLLHGWAAHAVHIGRSAAVDRPAL